MERMLISQESRNSSGYWEGAQAMLALSVSLVFSNSFQPAISENRDSTQEQQVGPVPG